MEEWALEVKEKLKDAPKFREGEIQKISLGDFTIIFLPGEPFMEFSKSIKSMGANVVAGYSNTGEVGYIPTERAFSEGGYEPDISYRWYNIWKYSPEVERTVLDAVSKLMKE